LPDWARFIGTWMKPEQSIGLAGAGGPGSGATRELQREQDRARDDAVVKSSTDKLSAVLDWLTDQVPASTSLLAGGSKTVEEVQAAFATLTPGVEEQEHRENERKKRDLETKKDLERFYVSLSRKLYDEGF